MAQGNIFEKNVYDKLKEKFNIVQVSFNNNAQSYEKYMETLDYINKGVDIIYQGVLHDYKNKLYGIPDLLVRSDKFNSIFNQQIKFPYHNSYYYVVVDIKHSTLHLNCNQEYIKDINSIPAYKGQILIYNRIINNIQKYNYPFGFILCKNICYIKNNINYSKCNFMENIAIINYNDDYYNSKVNNAINWIKKMRTTGHNWKLLPKPSVLELYPNMKNDKDDNYRKIKMQLSEKINEITNIWWCGYNKRQIAHSKKIFSWKDKRFNSKLINIGGKTGNTIDNILKINRNNSNYNSNSMSLINVSDLLKINNWRKNDNYLELYIDFETLNHNIGQVEINDEEDIIFMVSVGWEYNNKWECQTFMINKCNNDEELKMINDMWEFINNKVIELNKVDYKFIHWSHAEITFYNKFLLKHNRHFNEFKSFDLYKLFLDNNIVVKGALNFSLKTIANAMYKNKLINTCWDKSSICSNGLEAMYLAYNLYKSNDNNIINNEIMKEIIKYNIIDCKVMWEILSYLRNNY
jgi:hypothetical protein